MNDLLAIVKPASDDEEIDDELFDAIHEAGFDVEIVDRDDAAGEYWRVDRGDHGEAGA